MLRHFHTSVAGIPLPEKFTFPFYYTPHPLCVAAAKEVQDYLALQDAWEEELAQGEMFGVLVVKTQEGKVGYLAAFSGILAGKDMHPFFVPPVYDLLRPQGFFKKEEEQISQISARIRQLEEDETYRRQLEQLSTLQQTARNTLEDAKAQVKVAKRKREERRRKTASHPGFPLSPEEEKDLIRESQFQKAEYKRMERAQKEQIIPLQQSVSGHEASIQALKTERKARSAALQQRLFEQFKMLNYRGEVRTLCDIFEQTAHRTPPAGAGECAAPKLLQHACLHGWRPLAMAEFWWGESPKTEIRHHGHYYPACKGKCEPILKHVLKGLEVDENPMQKALLQSATQELETVYEDEWLLVVNKPADMLSVPGKEEAVSVYSVMRRRYPEADDPLIVHRLDMATSGLLVVAKTKQVHQNLQAQFRDRSVNKRCVALLQGIVSPDTGTVGLPLCLNPLDHPRQMMHTEHGESAVTDFEVLERKDSHTRITFYPRTGRTHQLRVHAAHPLGLHCPIIGDELYGKKAERLYLHAEALEFTHPITGKRVRINQKADF